MPSAFVLKLDGVHAWDFRLLRLLHLRLLTLRQISFCLLTLRLFTLRLLTQGLLLLRLLSLCCNLCLPLGGLNPGTLSSFTFGTLSSFAVLVFAQFCGSCVFR